MDIKTIGVEEWLNVWEKSATWDIAQSTISSLTMGELRALDEQDGATFYERLDREKMNYGWIEGSPEFKAVVAKLYRREVNPDHILQTNGCTGANLNAIMAVVEPGDHVIAEWPTYAPLYEIPRTLGAEVEYWELCEELGWKPDIEELKRLAPQHQAYLHKQRIEPHRYGARYRYARPDCRDRPFGGRLRAVRRGVSAARKH